MYLYLERFWGFLKFHHLYVTPNNEMLQAINKNN